MGTKNYKAFIVEGDRREPQILENLKRIHFKNSNFKIITIPAGQNIYVLWKKMKEDDFETDIIEVLRERNKAIEHTLEELGREDFSEVYLFFDYDEQQHNLKKDGVQDAETVILQMLQNFDNETENGKLYISYPMVEALKDYDPNFCGDGEKCFWNLENDPDESYKRMAAERGAAPNFRDFQFWDWKDAINVFAMRVSCLMGGKEVISFREYVDTVFPESVFAAQGKNIQDGRVMILSAFSEFLLDYFQESFWNACLEHTKLQKENPGCQKTINKNFKFYG